ncbi:hypothetical protein BKA08_003871 [Nocardioides marinisabuli]|uniref:Uncharacterized protein n=1 Tax=Nocardioides marinisabuli TaxID=419476 RepID=A0A7Y9JTJ3_9ACTN|nr:hypothetical protein [Nocardioides marinisabuli]NYD59633.1 hypothetical protein [Nocardioides marinisabuli]
MGKSKGKKSGKGSKGATVVRLPKTECCESRSKCGRCPLRMLKEGTLPSGYTVKKRRLVRLDGSKVTKKQLAASA